MANNNKLKVKAFIADLFQEEIWKDIPGYEGLYQASSIGNIRSLNYMSKKGYIKELSKIEQYQGYLVVDLCNPKTTRHSIHRLVAKTFIANPENKPNVNHIDGCKFNNTVNNLEWVTCSENHKHAFKFGLRKPTRGELSGSSKLTSIEVREIRQKYLTGNYTQK